MKNYFRIALMMVVAVVSTMGATRTSRTSGDWGSGTTWVGFVAPTSTDIVVIASGHNVTTLSDRTCAGLTITGTLTQDDYTTITVNGSVSGSGAWMTGTTNWRAMVVSGDWTFNGTSDGGYLRLTLTGSNAQTLSGKLSTGTNGDLTINKTAGTVTLGSAFTATGNFIMTAGTFDPGSYKLTASASTLTAGTLKVGAALWSTNYSFTPATPSSGFTIEYYNANPTINAAFTYRNLIFSGSGTAGASGALTIQGNLDNTGGGTLNFGSNAVTITGTSTQSIAGFTTTGLVSMTKTAGVATLDGNVTMGSFTLNGIGGTINFGPGLTHTVTGLLTTTNGTMQLSSSTLYINGTTNATGGSGDMGTSTVIYGGAAQSVLPVTYYHLSLAGSGVKTMIYGIAVNGTLTVNSGVTLATADYAVTLNGDFVNNGVFTAGASNITIGGANTQAIDGFTTTGMINIAKTGGTATFEGNVTADSLTFSGNNATAALGSGVVLTLASGLSIPLPTTATNTLSIGNGTLTCGPIAFGGTTAGTRNSVLSISTGTVNVTGNITSAGVASQLVFTGAGTLNVSGTFMSGVAGTFTPSTSTVVFTSTGAQAIAPFAYTFNNVTLTGAGSVKTLTNATINGILSMESTATASGAFIYGSAATLQYNTATPRTAGPEWASPFAATGGVVIANTGTITANNAKTFNTSVPFTINNGATFSTGNFDMTFGGDFVKNGTFTGGSASVTIAGTVGAQSISGFTTTGTVSLTKTSGTATFTGNVNGGAFTLNGAGGTLDLGPGLTHTFTGTFTRTNGTLNCNSSTLNIGGTVSGTGGSWTAGTSTVNFTGAGAQTIPGVSYYDLGFSGAGTKTIAAGTTVTVGRNWAVGSALTMTTTAAAVVTGNLSGSGAITMGSGSISLGGNWTNNGAFTAGTGTVTYNSATAQTLGAVTYNNLTTSGAGVKTAAGAVTVNGAFTNTSTVNMAAYGLSLPGTKDNTGGTLRFSGAANGVAVASGTVEYYGAAQTVGAGTYNNLTINESSGAATLAGSSTVNGVLAFTNGILATTGSYTLSLGASGSVTGASAARYVNGNLLKPFSTGAQSYTFPIGDASAYTPVAVVFGNISSGGTLTVSTAAGQHANIATSGINSAKDVARYWRLTNSGLVFDSYSAAYTFLAGDVIGGASTGSFVVRRYASSAWNTTSIGTRTATSSQATGLTAFGDFAIGNQLIDHYVVAASSPQTAGAAFATTVTAQDALNQTVTDDNSTVVTMSNSGSAQFDSNGDATFGDNTKTLSSGTFSIQTKDNVAQTLSLTATDGNSKTGTRAGVQVDPGAPSLAQSTITASPVSMIANGVTTSTITVQLIDAYNNNLTTGGGTVALSTTAGTLGGVTNNNNGTYTAVLTSPTLAGSATVTGTLNGSALTDNAVVTLTPGPAHTAHSTVTASPVSITANGVTTSAITVQLKDVNDNNLTTSGGTVALSTTAGTLGSVTDNANGTYSAVLTSATLVGTATLTATLNGSAITDDASVTFTVGAASVATSTISASPVSIIANGITTSTITVQLKDAFGNNLTSSGGTVALSTTAGTLGSVTNNNNGTYTAVLTSPTLVGSATITGTLNSTPITDNAVVTFTPGAANTAHSLITASPVSITANGSSTSTITIQLKDLYDNNLTSSGGTVALSTTAGTLGSVTDNANGTYTAVLTSPTLVGSGTVTGTLNGSGITDNAVVTFTVGAASTAQSTITASPTSITANGSSTSTLTVQLKDAFGNNLSTSSGTVVLSTTAGTLGSVTDNNNGTYTAVLTSPTLVGSATITGTLNGTAFTDDAVVTFTVGAASTAQSTITASSVSITADGVTTSTITVQLKDAFGNNLTSSGGTVVLAATAGTLGSVTDNNNGTYSAVLTSPTLMGSATITGTLNGSAITDDATVTFTVGAASVAQSTISAVPASITADGSSTSTVTVQLKDAFGNNLSTSGGTVVLSATAGTLGSATDNANGTYTAVLTSPTLVGSGTVTGTLNGSALTDNATVTFTAGAASLAQSTITASPVSITADGVTTSTITVQLKDAFGNNLTTSGGTVVLSSTAGSLGSITDNTNGTYSAVLTSSTAVGSATITGTLNGSALADDAAVAFTVGAVSIAHSTISASPTSVTADGSSTSTITVQLKDANNNNLSSSGGTVVLSTTVGTLGSVTDNANGTYTAVLTSPTLVGSATVTGTLNGSAITDDATVTFTVGAVSMVQSTITASPTSITADGVSTSTVTVQLKDAFGNNLTTSGGTVALSTTAGSLGSVTDNANGTYSAVLTSATLVGTATVTATLNGSPFTDDATVIFTVGAASVAQSTITASPASIIADGVTTSTITVQLKDPFGNNLLMSGGIVVLNTTGGTLGSVTDNANGTYSAVLTSPTTVGSATVTGTLNGSALTDDVTVAFTAGAPSVVQSTITASPTSITADGVTTSTVTVQLKDANNNNLPTGSGTVALNTTAGTLGAVTDNGNGTYTAVLISATLAGNATVTGTLNGSAFTDDATVTFTVGAASVAQSTITASPVSITADGVTTSTITVQLKDAFGNNLTSSAGTVVLSTTAGSLGSVTDNANGTYSAVLTSPTLVGSATITGTLNGSAFTDDAAVAFTVGAASLTQSTITASPTSITANGASTSTVTVQLKDAYGNNLTGSGGTVVLSTTAGTLGSVTDNSNGTYTAVLTSATLVGSGTLSGTLNGSAITDDAVVAFTVGVASMAQSTMTASPVSITADGSSTSTITVQLKDAFGNNLSTSGGTVVLSATAGTLGSVTDHANGTYTAVLTSPTLVGSATVTGTLNGSALSDDATVTFTVGAASMAQTTITALPTSITADGVTTSTITVQLKDAFGNNLPASGGSVVLSTTAGTLGSVTDNNNGTYTAVLTSPTLAGTATITGTLNGGALTDDAVVTLTPGAASTAQSVITASPASIEANGTTTSAITVQLKDAAGNNLSSNGGTVVLNTTAGTLGSVTDNANGTYSAILTSPTLAGSATITGTLNGSALTDDATVAFFPGEPSPTLSTITANPTSITADGTSTSAITIQLKDDFGNNLISSGGTVILSTTAGTLGSVTDHNNGTYSATLTSSTSVDTATITGAIDGVAGVDDATVIFTSGAASVTHSTVTASPVSITADGTSTSTITVQLKDVNDNNLASSGGTVVLSTTAGTLGSVTDHANGTYSAVLTSPTLAGSGTVTATLNGASITDDAVVTFAVGAASLAQSTISAAPVSITADGVTTSTIAVQLKDANGNNLTTSGGTVVLSATSGTLGSVTDNNNGTYSAVITSSTTVGSATITGTLNGSALTDDAIVAFTAGAPSVAQSTITAMPASITADGSSTSTITVQLKDAFGNNLSTSGGTVVLSSTSGTLGSVSDNNNGSYTAVLTSPTLVGSGVITGTLNGSAFTDDATVAFTVGAASLVQSTITASPASITADGITASTITVQLKDAFGNNLTTSSGTVALSVTSGTLGSVTDNSNGTYTAVLTSPTAVGSATVTGTLNGSALTDDATVAFTVGAASTAQSTITASPISITADGSSTSTITVQLKDANNNNLSSSGGTVALSTTAGTLGSVTDNNNGTYTAILTSPTLAGSGTITGTLNGSALTDDATVTFTVGAASLAQSTITASPVSITADGSSTSTVTVQLKDAFGNNLTTSGGTIVLNTTAGTLGSVTDNNNGTYSAVLTSSTTAGSATVTGTLNGSAITDDAAVAFTAGAVNLAQSTISASPTSITADGSSTSTITVQLKDAFGNNLSTSGGTIVLSATAGTLGSVTDNNNGTYSAILISPTLAGSATVTGTLNGSALTDDAAVSFTVGAASLAQSTITAAPASITADGVTTSTITVQLKDAFGNNLTASGGTVALSTTAGTLGIVTNNNNGTYTAVLTSPTLVGSATITGTLNGSSFTDDATVTFTVGAASVATSTISAAPASITADGVSTSTVTVQLKDAFGNNLTSSGGSVVLNTTAGIVGSVTDNANGTYSAVLTSSTTVGSATVSGTLNGSTITDDAVVTFTAGAVSLAQSTITASPTSITADGTSTSTVTVQLKDANGNNLTTSGGAVVLSATAGTLGSVTDNSNGTYTAVLTSPTAVGSATVTGTLNGSALTDDATVTFTVGAANVAQSTITASPVSITADGVTTSTITVQLKDAFGNNLATSGGTVVLSTTAGTLGSVTDNNNGTYSAVLTSSTTVGSATITGTLNGSALTDDATVTFTVGAVSVIHSTLTAAPTSITADGITTSTVTVQLKDANGNNLTSSGGTVVLSSTAGTLGSVTDNSNGTYTAVLTSATLAGSATVTGTLNGSAFTDDATVAFTVGAASVAQSTITASPTSITADGTSTSTVTVQLKDVNNNNLTTSGGVVVLNTTTGTLGSVTDHANGTYSAVLTSTTSLDSATITATLDGAALIDDAVVRFIVGAASVAHSTITASPVSIPADGSSTSTITVRLKDAFNHPLAASGGTVVLTTTAGTLGSVTDNNNGTYTAVLTAPAIAGSATIGGSLNGSAFDSSATVTFTPTSITIAGNAGTAGATLSWTDGTAKTTTADGSGNYSFTVSYLWSGTVTPSRTGYSFSPADRGYANLAADQAAQDYSADAVTYTISGNAGVAGATLGWYDGTAKTATADSVGNYSLTVSYDWSGAVKPALTGYLFAPESTVYANVLESKLLQNFTATPFVTADIKVFLSGPYSSGAMSLALNTLGRLPLTSETAYSPATFGYTAKTVPSIPAGGMVDWVLVELRTGTAAATKAAIQTAFIKSNGCIVDTNGQSVLLFKGVAAGNYYVVVRHRNHLAVMSAAAVALNASSARYDFSTGLAQAYGTNPMMALTGGGYGMWAGDVNRNNNVKYTGSQNDRSVLLTLIGLTDQTVVVPGYLNGDVNMDGVAKFTGSSNDNSVILRTVSFTDQTRTVTTQVPN